MRVVDIVIITTRADEYRSVFNRLKEYAFRDFNGPSGRSYALFSVPARNDKTCEVALVRSSEQGSDVAQQIATDAMRDLDPQLVLVVGIAGGIPHNEFTLGDVVVSSYIHNFNVSAFNQDEITFNGSGSIHPLVGDIAGNRLYLYENFLASWNEESSLGLARPMLDLSWAQANVYGDKEWRAEVLKSLNTHFGGSTNPARLPLFQPGSIASSNSLMKNTTIPTTWRGSARNILAVEMESAGVLQAAQQIGKQYPVMAIRGISDIIGLKRDERWTSYACQAAASFTCAFIKAAMIEPRKSDVPPGLSRDDSSNDKSTLPPGKITVFISYSAGDEKLEKELEKHLSVLKRDGTIHPLSSLQRKPGSEWTKEVRGFMDRSQIILLLISPDFLADDYLFDQEMGYAMERRESSNACVVPIIIRAAELGKLPLNKLQALPFNRTPVDRWANQDAAWAEIAKAIREICDKLLGSQDS